MRGSGKRKGGSRMRGIGGGGGLWIYKAIDVLEVGVWVGSV